MKITEVKTYKQEVLTDIVCDSCGASCAKFSSSNKLLAIESAKLTAQWGYYSDSDGKQYEIELCENCFYDLIAYMKSKNFTDRLNPI